MQSYHFLFTVVAGSGHLFTTLAMADELTNRGHRVTLVTSPEVKDAVEATGADFAPYRSAFEGFHLPDVVKEDNAEELCHNVYVADNEAMLRAAEDVAARDRPDAVVYEIFHFIAGKLLAAKLNRPGVRLTGIASNEHYSLWDDLRRAVGQGNPEEFESVRQKLTSLLSEAGIDRPIREFWDEIDDCNIVWVPRSYQVAGETFDDRFVFAGPVFTPQQLEAQWEPPDGEPPVLLVSLGSTWNEHPEFFKTCAHAFEGTPWHVVLVIGEFIDPAELGDLPANVEARSWVSFVDVLRHASAFMMQGTCGATMASMYRGCPLLVFDHFAVDAAPTATRALALGLGHRLGIGQISPAGLREAVSDLVADEDVQRRVDAMRREIDDCGGVARAADAIVEHLASVLVSETGG